MRGFGFRFADILTVELKMASLELPSFNVTNDDGTVLERQSLPQGGYSKIMSLIINGEDAHDALQSGLSYRYGEQGRFASVHMPAESHPDDAQDGPAMVITTPYVKLVIYVETEEVLHYDIQVSLAGGFNLDDLHGVLGQTARWGRLPDEDRVIQGDEPDYITPGLLDPLFKFSTYGRMVNKTRKARVMKEAVHGTNLLVAHTAFTHHH